MRTRHSSASTFRVRYSETDQMGVAYHVHYLVWCEIARTDYMRELGTPYAQLERDGVFLVVAEASLRYLAPARYDDVIHVNAWIERAQSRAVTFGYEIARESGSEMQRLATATTKLIAVDRGGSPRTLPPPLLRKFGEVFSKGSR